MAAETLDTRALNMLITRIVEEEARRTPQLKAAADWTDFQQRCGFLLGLEHVKSLCKQVEDDLYGKKRTP